MFIEIVDIIIYSFNHFKQIKADHKAQKNLLRTRKRSPFTSVFVQISRFPNRSALKYLIFL